MSASPQSSVSTSPAGTSAPSQFRLFRVLLIIVPVALICVTIIAFVLFGDAENVLADLTRPPIAPVSGQVFFNDKPLADAQIFTEPVGGNGSEAMGWTDDQGNYSLKTDIRGKLIDGATVGEHKVAVLVYADAAPFGEPPLLTPRVYARVGTTPLRINVSRDEKQNQFKLELEGEVEERPRRGGGGGPPARPPTDNQRRPPDGKAGKAAAEPDSGQNPPAN